MGSVSASTGAAKHVINRAARRILIVFIILEVRREACPETVNLGIGLTVQGGLKRLCLRAQGLCWFGLRYARSRLPN